MMTKHMHIWICGGDGMLGSELRRQLKHIGWSYNSTDKEVNICDSAQLNQYLEKNSVTHVINCAGYTQVDQAEIEPDLAYAINAEGPKLLAQACKRHKCHLIHISTDYVFDGRSDSPYKETAACHPLSVYGKSKLLGENNIQDNCQNYSIIRTSWLMGQDGRNFVRTMMEKMSSEESLRIVNDQVGRVTFCKDLSEAILNHLLDFQGVIHFANQEEISWYELAKEVFLQLKENAFPLAIREIIPVSSQEYKTLAERPANSVLNTEQFESLVKQPIRSYKKALEEYLHEATARV